MGLGKPSSRSRTFSRAGSCDNPNRFKITVTVYVNTSSGVAVEEGILNFGDESGIELPYVMSTPRPDPIKNTS
jgi:hypothetical protein